LSIPVKINPRKLRGPWTDGFALDVHTTGSTFLGYNAYGHPEFDTARSPLGDLVYRLKNRGDRSAIEPIVETVVAFLKTWQLKVDAIVPVPPSNTARKSQPVMELATVISERTGIPLCAACVSKVKSTAQLKDIFERPKRDEILADAFAVDRGQTKGKRLLVFDDLYRSGATAGAISKLLAGEGAASSVYLLTLTQTRKKL
jgi:predicted amidophosphoribosyltransferase